MTTELYHACVECWK